MTVHSRAPRCQRWRSAWPICLPPFDPAGPELFELLLPLARGEAPVEAVLLKDVLAVQLWLLFSDGEVGVA